MHIHTLIPDIYELIKRKDGWLTHELADDLGRNVSRRLEAQFAERQATPTLRLSKMGPSCPCALWHSIHTPELAEPLPAWAEIKYSFGHITEAYLLTLAKASGHLVTGEQDELILDGIRGHRDCVIDGCVVDIKSCSSIQFQKYKTGSIREGDSFGYLDQLDAYLAASALDDLVTVKDKAYILAVDKTLGHCCLYEHHLRQASITQRIREYKEIVGQLVAPKCSCGTVPDGKSGNYRLDTRASYSPFKFSCFPNLRTFLYSDGPRYLTHIERRPDVTEVDRNGQVVYNY